MSIATAISHPTTRTSTAARRWRTSPDGVKRLSGRSAAPLRAVPADARTLAPAGVTQSQRAARGIVLYVGLDEETAGASGTNLTAVAAELQRYARELVAEAQTQTVIALAPEGRGTDLDAVRAVVSGSPAATGGEATATVRCDPAFRDGLRRRNAVRPPHAGTSRTRACSSTRLAAKCISTGRPWS